MSNSMRTTLLLLTLASTTIVLAHDGPAHHRSSDQPIKADSFDTQMETAMERMHRDMAVPPSGDSDRDFAAMMIPHHQGAVDMARIQLQFGKDPVLRRLAQAIIVEQLQEIQVMRRRLSDLPQVRGPHTSDGQSNKDSKDH